MDQEFIELTQSPGSSALESLRLAGIKVIPNPWAPQGQLIYSRTDKVIFCSTYHDLVWKQEWDKIVMKAKLDTEVYIRSSMLRWQRRLWEEFNIKPI